MIAYTHTSIQGLYTINLEVYLKAVTYLNILRPTKRKARAANTHCTSRLVTRKGMISKGVKMEARSR